MIQERWLNLFVLTLLLALPLWALWSDEPFTITLTTRVVILAIAAVGLNIALGIGGMVSLGHALFFGVGGYSMGILAYHAQTYEPLNLGLFEFGGSQSMLLIWLVAILASTVIAWCVGSLVLRTRGVYFIMITLAFGQMFYYLSISSSRYGGEDGMSIYLRNQFPGLNTLDPFQFFALCFSLLLLSLLIFHRVRHSPFGLALNAARQVPERVKSVGMNPDRIKLVAFTLSAAITGLAGALYADLNRFVSPSLFSWQLSGELIILIILGGVGRLCGPVIGAALFVALEHWLGAFTDYWQICLGLALLLVVLFARGGVVGLVTGKAGPHV